MSLFEINELWIPAMGARLMDNIAFKLMLEQIRADLGPGSIVKGNVTQVLVTVTIPAASAEEAKTSAILKIARVMANRPFMIDEHAERTAVDLG